MITALSVSFEYSGSQGSVSGLRAGTALKAFGDVDSGHVRARVLTTFVVIERNACGSPPPTKF